MEISRVSWVHQHDLDVAGKLEVSLTGSGTLDLTAAADWQGVAYPSQWDAEATTGLLESLHAVNYHSLAGIVSDRLEKGGAARAAAD